MSDDASQGRPDTQPEPGAHEAIPPQHPSWPPAPPAPTPAPQSGPPYATPQSGPPYATPQSGPPYATPQSGPPYATPHSPAGYPGDAYTAPDDAPTEAWQADPYQQAEPTAYDDSRWADDPAFADPVSTSGPSRIEWSQPAPKRGKLVPALIAGLVVGVLAAGAGGFFIGRGTADEAGPVPPGATPSASLPPYEANLVALNKTKFSGEAAALAEPWLAAMGGCTANTDTGGPGLSPGELTHVLCRNGGVFLHFASYRDAAQKEVARNYRQQLALVGPELAPGLTQPQRRTGEVTSAQGLYIEYAFKGSDGRPLCGIWWDRDGAAAAVYLEALCQETLGGDWGPLRDLWQRHS
ncbi:hypothetical protein O7635_25460 [Asanoa sp. WMMD1127]|uniref:hypothetical protein n=1 Tax=Asanoa sp. WMMD1127 TaxID=3016107 RepID=UPI002417E75E|nr:hypothetical protein [Asanoa sp. WMMD1127]MDG4825208.1 hypothetical protein [Asanoa sp. WMMD1127]